MPRGIARIAGPLLVLSVITACSGKQTGPAGDPAAKPAERQELRLSLSTEPPTLDPAKAKDSVSFQVLAQTTEGLIRIGEDDAILPGVAETWTVDGTTYTFHLRRDAKWSDGEPVTADDFRFAWLRALDPKVGSPYSYQLYYIEGAREYNALKLDDPAFLTKAAALRERVAVIAVDDYTLRVTLIQPTAYWLALTSFPTYYPQRAEFVAGHGEKYAADADKLIANGPFVVTNWTHGARVVLGRNANYWDAKKVRLERVTYQMVKDTATIMQMYDAGELDEIVVPGEYAEKYRNEPGFSAGSDVVTYYLALNVKQRNTANINLRKAISYAIDRKLYADAIVKGGSLPSAGLVPDSMAGPGGKTFRQFSGDYLPARANRDEAKRYWEAALKELGGTQVTVKLLTTEGTTAKRYAEVIQEMLQSALAGLTIDIEQVSLKARIGRTKAGDFEMTFLGWQADYNDPLTFLNMWTSTSPQNETGWSNSAYDALIRQAERTTDEFAHMEALARAEKLLMSDLPVVPLYSPATNRVRRPYLKGVVHAPLVPSTDLKLAYIEGKGK